MDKYFNNIHTVVIHAGIFHTDDMMVAAWMTYCARQLNLTEPKIIRTYKIDPDWTIENGFLVADIGNTKYDHHSLDKEKRDNEVPYAAFGKVVRDFHNGILSDDEYKYFDKWIQPLDDHDNNGTDNDYCASITMANKKWNDTINTDDDKFFRKLPCAIIDIEEKVESIKALLEAKEEIYNGEIIGDVLYLNRYAPVSTYFQDDPNINFIGSPALRGGYQIISIKNSDGNNKRLFPESVRGFNRSIDPKYNMIFCHSSGFIATFKDKECAKAYMNAWDNNFQD